MEILCSSPEHRDLLSYCLLETAKWMLTVLEPCFLRCRDSERAWHGFPGSLRSIMFCLFFIKLLSVWGMVNKQSGEWVHGCHDTAAGLCLSEVLYLNSSHNRFWPNWICPNHQPSSLTLFFGPALECRHGQLYVSDRKPWKREISTTVFTNVCFKANLHLLNNLKTAAMQACGGFTAV